MQRPPLNGPSNYNETIIRLALFDGKGKISIAWCINPSFQIQEWARCMSRPAIHGWRYVHIRSIQQVYVAYSALVIAPCTASHASCRVLTMGGQPAASSGCDMQIRNRSSIHDLQRKKERPLTKQSPCLPKSTRCGSKTTRDARSWWTRTCCK